jgi:hypothetical protein
MIEITIRRRRQTRLDLADELTTITGSAEPSTELRGILSNRLRYAVHLSAASWRNFWRFMFADVLPIG